MGGPVTSTTGTRRAEPRGRESTESIPEIVAEEIDLLERVVDLLANLPEQQTPSERPIIEELRRLREQIISRRESKDMVSLNEQWHRLNSLLQQLRTSRDAPKVDPRSPSGCSYPPSRRSMKAEAPTRSAA